jgi:hypothetical protein
MKLDDCALHPDGRRRVEIYDRMMGSQRSGRNEHHENGEQSWHQLFHL